MYTVFVDDEIMYHPRMINRGYCIYNPVLTMELNKSGSFRFNLPVVNAHYNDIKKMSSIIKVYDGNELIFRGRVLDDERTFNNNKSVYCEGELAFLLDSIIRPTTYKGTVAGLFSLLVTSHNQDVDTFKRFTVGECTVLSENEVNVSIDGYPSAWSAINSYLLDVYGGYLRIRHEDELVYLDYITSFNSTNDQVIEFGENLLDIDEYITAESVFTKLVPLGSSYPVEIEDNEVTSGTIDSIETEPIGNRAGNSNSEFKFKLEVVLNSKNKATGKSNITINYYGKATVGSVSFSGLSASKIYADIQVESKQKVKTGANGKTLNSTYILLATWTGEVNTDSISINAEFINKYTTKDTKPISNSMGLVCNLLQQKYVYTNISGVEGQDGRDYITASQEIVDLFGLITKVNVWSDVSDATELLQLAQDYMTENNEMSVSLNINAIDLHLLNVAYEKFKMGDMIRVLSKPHGIDRYFLCRKLSLDLQSPENNVYSLGSEFKTLTEQHVSAANSIVVASEQISNIFNNLDENENLVDAVVETIYDQISDTITVIDNLDVTYADIDFANIGTAAIDNLVANQAFITELNARYASVAYLTANYLTANEISAAYATIDFSNIGTAAINNLVANQAFITELNARYASVAYLTANYLTASEISAAYAAIDFANIGSAAINNLVANQAFITELNARYASVAYLTANYLTASQISAAYATVDLANITTGAFENIFGDRLVTDYAMTVDGYVTGTLEAVNISGDLITAGTILADRIIIRANDGNPEHSLYYELNASTGNLTETQLADPEVQNALHGSNIVAQSVTANQIAAATITSNEIAANTITAGNIAAGTITAVEMAAGSISSTQIQSDAILAEHIKAGEISADKLTLEFNNKINGLEENVTTLTNSISIDPENDLITIMNGVTGMKMQLTSTTLAFILNNISRLAWLDANEGLGAPEISIGPADQLVNGSWSSNIGNRWRITVSDDGSRLRFSRHEGSGS